MMRYGKANVRTYIIASLSFPFHLLDRCLPMARFRYPRGSDKHDRVSQTKQNLMYNLLPSGCYASTYTLKQNTELR